MTTVTDSPNVILTPVGRYLSGDAYKARTKDADNNPLVVKHGPNAGQPREEYYIGLGIPKGSEQHWSETTWGQKIMALARTSFPSCFDPATGYMYQGREVACKIDDGDSQIPNTKGNKPCDREGWPGHWIIHFSNGYPPTYTDANGSKTLHEQVIKRGHYVQVFGEMTSNNSLQKPGIYLNLKIIAHSGYGPEIQGGVDASEVGFGGALPPGASATPVGGMQMATTPVAPVPGQMATTPVAPVPGQMATPPVAPVPAHDLVAPVPGQMATPPVAPAIEAPTTPAAVDPRYDYNGMVYSLSQLRAGGWTDTQIAGLTPVQG